MIARVFAFIWGANLLTLLLVSVMIFFVDLTPPQEARRIAEPDLLKDELALILDAAGPAAALTFWDRVAATHPGYAVTQDAACATPDAIGTPQTGCVTLLRTSANGDIANALRPVTLPLFLGALVSAAMAIWLSRWLTRPIRAVSHGLKALSAGQLGTRIRDRLRTSNRELQDLGRDFDHAAARLQSLSDSRNRLFHDISHEIRSPLARLRAAVGLIEVNPSRGAALAGRMEGDIARLDHLVDEILTLARFERGERTQQVQQVDLLDLLENIIADANFEGRAQDITVRYSGADVLMVPGDPELLHRACENVIRNALSHSPPGGTVFVTGAVTDQDVRLDVTDAGPGVPEADLTAIFDPFVRLDTRSDTGSVGLGLAIAHGAVQSHGGRITAQNRQGGGLTVSLRLPTRDGAD